MYERKINGNYTEEVENKPSPVRSRDRSLVNFNDSAKLNKNVGRFKGKTTTSSLSYHLQSTGKYRAVNNAQEPV